MADQKDAQQVLDYLSHIYENPFSDRTPRERVRQTLETRRTLELARDLRDQPEELLRYAAAIIQICDGFHLRDLAVEWRRISLETSETIFSPESPERVKALYHHGRALHEAGRLQEAKAQVFTAIDLCERNSGAAGMSAGSLNRLLARIVWDLGDYDKPEALFEEAVQRLADENDSRPGDLVDVLLDYAAFLDDRGDFDRAGALFPRALAVAERSRAETDRLAKARVYHNLGNHLWRTPRYAQSEIYLRKALEIYQKNLPEWDAQIAACMNDLSAVLLRSIRRPDSFDSHAASEFWAKAWKIRQKIFGEESLEVAESLFLIARN